MKNYMTRYIERDNSFSKIFTIFVLSTALNNKVFFLDFAGVSIRPYMITMCLGLLYLIVSNKYLFFKRKQTSMIAYIYIFLLVSYSTVFVSPYFDAHSNLFLNGILLIFSQILTFYFMVLMINNLSKGDILKAIKVTIFFMSISGILLYMYHVLTKGFINFNESYLGINYSYQGRPRLMGTVGDPNYYSLYLSVYFWLYVMISTKNEVLKYKKLSMLFVINILLTQSRTAILLNGLFILFVLVYYFRKKFKDIFKLLFLTVSLLVMIFLFNNYIVNLSELFLLSNDASVNNRQILFIEGLKNINRYPFGVGPGYIQEYYYEFTGLYKVAHNDFLSVFIETGIIGLILYLWIYVYCYIKASFIGRLSIIMFIGFAFSLTMYYYDPIIILFFTIIVKSYSQDELSEDD